MRCDVSFAFILKTWKGKTSIICLFRNDIL